MTRNPRVGGRSQNPILAIPGSFGGSHGAHVALVMGAALTVQFLTPVFALRANWPTTRYSCIDHVSVVVL